IMFFLSQFTFFLFSFYFVITKQGVILILPLSLFLPIQFFFLYGFTLFFSDIVIRFPSVRKSVFSLMRNAELMFRKHPDWYQNIIVVCKICIQHTVYIWLKNEMCR